MTNTRREMFDKFQPWVLATYGDSAKTKTITLRKAHRIQESQDRSLKKINSLHTNVVLYS